MRWLHISDIHCDPNNSNTGTLMMRDTLPDFLRSNIKTVDAVFMTGDFRFAKTQEDTDDNARIAVDMLLKIAKAVGVIRIDGTVDTDRIFTVPGNHDLDRAYPNRQDLIKPIKDKYSFTDGFFQKDNLKLMLDSFTFYRRVLKYLYGEGNAKRKIDESFSVSPHTHAFLEEVNLLLLNTALLAQDSNTIDPHNLLVGHTYVAQEIKEIKKAHPDKPIIVLSHHAMSQLNDRESTELKKIFGRHNIKLYLCGHSHELWNDKINEINNITVGCMAYGKEEQAGFSIGEYNPDTGIISIQAYEWNQNFAYPRWVRYPGLGNEKNDLLLINTCSIRTEASQTGNEETKLTVSLNGKDVTIDVFDIIKNTHFGHEYVIYTVDNIPDSDIFASILNEKEMSYSLDTIENKAELAYINEYIKKAIDTKADTVDLNEYIESRENDGYGRLNDSLLETTSQEHVPHRRRRRRSQSSNEIHGSIPTAFATSEQSDKLFVDLNGRSVMINVLDIVKSDNFGHEYIIYTTDSISKSSILASILDEKETSYSLNAIENKEEVAFINAYIKKLVSSVSTP